MGEHEFKLAQDAVTYIVSLISSEIMVGRGGKMTYLKQKTPERTLEKFLLSKRKSESLLLRN
jgi:hypothetical protein